jgi:hypothetical protein
MRRRLTKFKLLLVALPLVVTGLQALPVSAGRVADTAPLSLPLSGSIAMPDSSSAVVVMGKNDGQHDLFWQLFGFDTTKSRWALITPPGVADNGGLMVSGNDSTGLLVGFGASQGLTFSPLALTTDGGTAWSPGGLAEPLASVPSAIALGANSTAVALVDEDAEEVLARAGSLTSWTPLTTETKLAALAAGRACGVQSIDAVDIAPNGDVILGVSCRQPGRVGVFAKTRTGWSLGRVPLSGKDRSDTFDALRITTAGNATGALFYGADGTSKNIVAAWASSSGDTNAWTLSAPLQLGAHDEIIASGMGTNGSQFVVVRSASSTRAEIISGPRSSWQTLSSLPAATATIATEPNGRLVALSVSDTNLTVWEQDAKSDGWEKAQSLTVPIVFGSSA